MAEFDSQDYLYPHVKWQFESKKKCFKNKVIEFHPHWHGSYSSSLPEHLKNTLYSENSDKFKFQVTFPNNKICKKNKCKQKFIELQTSHFQDLNLLFEKHCLQFLEKISITLVPWLNVNLNENSVIIWRAVEIANIFKYFLPYIPKYFNYSIIKFLKKVVLSKDKNCFNDLRIEILLILFHFTPDSALEKEDYENFFDLTVYFKSRTNMSYHDYFTINMLNLVGEILWNMKLKPLDKGGSSDSTTFFLNYVEKAIYQLKEDLDSNLHKDRFSLISSMVSLMFTIQNNVWQQPGLSKICSENLISIISEVMKYPQLSTKTWYVKLLERLCSIICYEIEWFFCQDYKEIKNLTFIVGENLLNQNKLFLLEIIYFLEMNNLKHTMKSETIEKILKYNLIPQEEIPDRFLDSITCQRMTYPVQLPPSPEIVDYSTYRYLDITTGKNPFTRGDIKYKICNDLKEDIKQWQKTASVSLGKKNSYLGKFLHHYNYSVYSYQEFEM